MSLDMSWNAVLRMGDSMVGFLLRAAHGTSVSHLLAVKWDEAEDGNRRLYAANEVTAKHNLSRCKVAFEQGNYTWRHNKVLSAELLTICPSG